MWAIFKKDWTGGLLFTLVLLVIGLGVLDVAACSRGWSLLGVTWVARHGWTYDVTIRVQGFTQNPFTQNPLPVGEWGYLCAIAAGVIAVRQVYLEKWQQTWSLLIQLPITRARAVYAKLLAGLALYALVMAPMGLIVTARLQMPGVWPGPVYVRSALALFLLFIMGASVYLTAFLMALRQAYWYGTKLLPLPSALAMVGAVMAVIETCGRDMLTCELSRNNVVAILVLAVLSFVMIPLCIRAIREQSEMREY
jgi:hypothetical protein